MVVVLVVLVSVVVVLVIVVVLEVVVVAVVTVVVVKFPFGVVNTIPLEIVTLLPIILPGTDVAPKPALLCGKNIGIYMYLIKIVNGRENLFITCHLS